MPAQFEQDVDIPVDVLNQLNEIIDESNDAVATAHGPDDESADDVELDAMQSAAVSDGADEDQPDVAAQGHLAADEMDADDSDPGTAALATEGESAITDDAGDDAPLTVEALQAQLQQVQGQLTTVLTAAQQAEEDRIAKQAEAQANAQYDRFMAELADMDPEDAEKAKSALVMNFASGLLRQQMEARQQVEETNQRQAAIAFIKAGGRVVPNGSGGYDRIATHAKPLTDAEAADLELFDHPQKMESYADRVIARRQQQTVRARQVLAERRKAAGEGQATGSGGGPAAPPAGAEPTTLDEFWLEHDSVYGGTPPANRDTAYGLNRR